MAEQVVSGSSPPVSAPVSALPTTDDRSGRAGLTGHGNLAKLSRADIHIALQIDLGTVSMSLQELEQLTPGQTLLLTRNSDLPVELRCCGEKVASARLVQVNGQLAVQVAQLHAPHAYASHDGGTRERTE